MTTQKQAEEQEVDSSKTRARGPGVPTISLDKALGLMRKVWENEKRNAAPVASILSHWDYSAKSSGGFLAIASMKRYGLMDDQGNNEKRTLRLSQLALDLLKNEGTNAAEYQNLIKEAALKPEMHRYMWDKYGAELPSDQTLRSHLIFDKHFLEDTAKAFIGVYRDTISFAKLNGNDTVNELAATEETDQKDPEKTKPLQPPLNPKPPTPPMIPAANPGEASIPIGDRFARVPFPMADDDYDLLIGTLQLWKKKLVRAIAPAAAPIATNFPRQAVWKNKDHDKHVTIMGVMGDKNGETYYQTIEGTGIPGSELEFVEPQRG